MKKYKNFEETSVWQTAHEFVLNIYKTTEQYPANEKYVLQSQFRSAAISIEANIAEAFGRYHYLDKLRFYYNSRGSAEECKSHLITSKDLKYILKEDYEILKNKLLCISEELNKIIVSIRCGEKKSKSGVK